MGESHLSVKAQVSANVRNTNLARSHQDRNPNPWICKVWGWTSTQAQEGPDTGLREISLAGPGHASVENLFPPNHPLNLLDWPGKAGFLLFSLKQESDHFVKSPRLGMLKRRDPVAVSDGCVGTRLDQCADRRDMRLAPVAEDHRLDQRCPAQVVDVIQRGTACDQLPHDLVMAKMGRRDQGRSVIDAGHQIGPVSKLDR
jgi:hypothetical protein